MKVIFSHGKESGPWGSKIKRLAQVAEEHGCSVESIDYTDTLDPDVRADRLVGILNEVEGDILLVGSSMGGYVSMVAAEEARVTGVFLLAPALYIPGYKQQNYTSKVNVEIVHGWSDDIIPPENSIKFAKSADCSLHLISGDHRLNSSIEVVETLFAQFLTSSLRAKTDW